MNRRLLAITVGVLAAHAALLQLAPAPTRPSAPLHTEAFVTRTIEAAQPQPQPPKEAGPREAPRPSPGARRPPGPAVTKQAAAATPAEPKAEPPAKPESPPAFIPGTDVELAAAAAPLSAASEPAAPQAFAIPEPARLHYDIVAETRFGITVTSSALLTWKHDGVNYEALLEAGGGILPKRVQRSAGLITAEGLAPLRFSDKSRSEQATHFERDKGKLTFSNNKPDAALVPGIQDRLSIVVQLAAMVAGAPAKYPAGSSITIPTASTSEAENWVFTVEGEEDLQLPGGRLRGLKLQRMPRREYDVKVELWLAPGMDYAPVRLRLTNPNGDSVDQRWAGTDRG